MALLQPGHPAAALQRAAGPRAHLRAHRAGAGARGRQAAAVHVLPGQ